MEIRVFTGPREKAVAESLWLLRLEAAHENGGQRFQRLSRYGES